jgi:predicted  nucleic acid-binding Zn-ribbon protein
MITEDKVQALRAQADNNLRTLAGQFQEVTNTINSLEQQLQHQRNNHAQLVNKIIDAQAVLAAFNLVLDGDGSKATDAKDVN